jgi:hypothetical protein
MRINRDSLELEIRWLVVVRRWCVGAGDLWRDAGLRGLRRPLDHEMITLSRARPKIVGEPAEGKGEIGNLIGRLGYRDVWLRRCGGDGVS